MQKMSFSDAVSIGNKPCPSFWSGGKMEVLAPNAWKSVKVNKKNIKSRVIGRIQSEQTPTEKEKRLEFARP